MELCLARCARAINISGFYYPMINVHTASGGHFFSTQSVISVCRQCWDAPSLFFSRFSISNMGGRLTIVMDSLLAFLVIHCTESDAAYIIVSQRGQGGGDMRLDMQIPSKEICFVFRMWKRVPWSVAVVMRLPGLSAPCLPGPLGGYVHSRLHASRQFTPARPECTVFLHQLCTNCSLG